MRASLATVIPLAAGQFLPQAGAETWMSLGGFNGALSDRGGSYRSRAMTMAVLMTTGALAATIGVLAAGHLVATLVLTFAIAFTASLLRVWGNAGISIGSATLTVFVVSLAIPAHEGGGPATRFVYVLLGGVWAMGIALVLWPLRPYRPARLAVSRCYEALAEYTAQVAEQARSQHTTEWPVQATPAAITNVRTALEEASAVLVQIRRGRPGKVDRGERLLVLSESADQLFAHVIALGEALTTLRGASRVDALHDRVLALLGSIAATAREIAAGIESEGEVVRVAVQWNGDDLRASFAGVPRAAAAPYEHVAVILDRAAQFASAASVTLEALDGGTPDTGAIVDAAHTARSPVAEDVPDERAPLDFLRAMLSPGSLILRFAMRVAVVTTLAVAITHVFDLKRGYWLTITAIVILQPYAGVTLMRAVQRVLGTVLGALLAAALGAYFHDPRSILVIATVFVACCVALLPINYAAFSVFLTPTFVLLAEAGAGDWHLASTRVTNTLLGGALALVGSRLLWPSPERARFPTYGADALRANAEYLRRVLSGFNDRSHASGERMREARRAVGLATVNAEESLQRAVIEAHGDRSTLAPALTLLAYIRRFTASVAALAIARHSAETTESQLDGIERALVPALEELAAALDGGRLPADLPDIEGAPPTGVSPLIGVRVERLFRQAETLHDAVSRLAVVPATSERNMLG